MTVIVSTERQYPLTAVLDMGVNDFDAANCGLVPLPPGALLTGITAVTTVAFNSATTAVLDLGDAVGSSVVNNALVGGTVSQTALAAAINIRDAAGAETVPLQGRFYPSGGYVVATLTQTGAAATAGRLLITVSYIITGRVNEVQG